MQAEEEFGQMPIVIQIDNNTFQVFSNGRVPLFEVIGAVRAEILKKRGLEVPVSWRELKKPGILEGTEPLYFRKGNSDFIAWGSLTHTGVESWHEVLTKEKIVSVILRAIDLQWWPQECKEKTKISREDCKDCSVYHWHLKRCYQKRAK
jgi:hypothetical protein